MPNKTKRILQNRTFYLIAALVIAGLAGLNPRFVKAQSAQNVTVTNEMVKLKATDAPPTATSASIQAAQNESAAFQAVVTGPATGVTMTAPTLTGPNGATIPAANVRLYREAYQNITTASNSEGGTGLYPDALVPDVDEVANEKRNAFPFNVAAGQIQAVWVDVLVPQGQTPGTYQGTLGVTGSGIGTSGTAGVPVTLFVYDFSLPSTSSLPSSFGNGWDAACIALYGSYNACGGDAGVEQTHVMVARFMLDHRITTNVVYSGPANCAGTNCDWTHFDATYGALFNGTDSQSRLKGAQQTSILYVWNTTASSYYAGWAQHFRANGWFNRTFDYTCDEPPNGCTWSAIPNRAAIVHGGDPQFPTLVTTSIQQASSNGVLGSINILSPVVNWMDDKSGIGSPYEGNQRPQYNSFLSGNSINKLFWYQSCMSQGCGGNGGAYNSGWPSFMVDDSASQNRAQGVQSWLFKVNGVLYYDIDYMMSSAWSGVYAFGGNGDGTLIYPGTPSVIGGQTPVPVASIRLKMIREGFQDYEYLKLVNDLGDPNFAQQTAQTLFPSLYQSNQSPAAFAAMRQALANRILALKGSSQAGNTGATTTTSSGSTSATGTGTASGTNTGTSTSTGTSTGTGASTPGTTTTGGTTTAESTGTSTGSTSPAGAVTRIEQNASAVTYAGSWVSNTGSFNSGGSAAMAMGAGATATLSFNGTGVTWIGYQDEWSGIASVSLDGKLAAQVDTYASPGKTQSAVYSTSGLSNGPHTLTITVTGNKDTSSQGSWVWVDAFDVISSGTATSTGSGTTSTTGSTTPTGTSTSAGSGTTSTTGSTGSTTPSTPATTTRIEQNASAVTYTGSWVTNTGSFNSGGSATMAMGQGSSASLKFSGTGVTWIGYQDEWSGIAQVYLDGSLKSQVDTYASPGKTQSPVYSVSGLTNGPHTLTITVTGNKDASSQGAWVWVDAFDVISGGSTTTSTTGTTTLTGTTSSGTASAGTASTGSSASSTGTGTGTATSTAPGTTGTSEYRVEQSSPAVQWTGAWSVNNGGFNSGGSAKLSMAAGARATFTFVGTSVSWIAYRDEWSGIAHVYIDGKLIATVDTYATPARAQTVAYTTSGLPMGTHTIAIEAAGTKDSSSGGSWVWVDAFDYVGAALTSATSTADPSTASASLGGGMTLTSSGGVPLLVGSAEVDGTGGGLTPAGLALISDRQNGVISSEAGVPASVPVLRGRIDSEISSSVNTGVAVANPNDTAATVSFFFTDANGTNSASGSLTLPPHGQLAKFLNEAPFNGTSNSSTFTFSSTVPVSAIALRGLTNERSEFLMTTLPIANPDAPSPATAFFPHVPDGGGWTTQFVLVNPTDSAITGTLQFVNQAGQPGTSTHYQIAPRSVWRYSTADTASAVSVGSAEAIPDESNMAPVGVAIFSLRQNGITISTAGVPSLESGTAFRLYAEVSADGTLRTGMGIVNATEIQTTIQFDLVNLDGTPTGLTGTLSLPAFGQQALFLDQVPGFASLPKPFHGIVRLSSQNGVDFAVIGLRGRVNERSEFIMTTTAPTNENAAGVPQIVFPQIANGGGFLTQFVLYSGTTSEPSTGTLDVHNQSGGTMNPF